MILEILQRTPVWVFFLFALLVYLGFQQSSTRTVSPPRLAILPAALLALSLHGVISAFGASPLALGAWSAALAASALLISLFRFPKGIIREAGAFKVPGSWVPFALMMIIFFTRYAIAVSLARDPSLRQAAGFIAAVAVSYGLPTGYFVARTVNILRTPRPA
jgi:hypothetical protein